MRDTIDVILIGELIAEFIIVAADGPFRGRDRKAPFRIESKVGVSGQRDSELLAKARIGRLAGDLQEAAATIFESLAGAGISVAERFEPPVYRSRGDA